MDNNELTFPDSARQLYENLQALYNLAESSMRGHVYDTHDDLRNIILLQITSSTVRITGSVIKQISNNGFYGIDFMLRPLVEGLINYSYIKADDTQMRARAFIADDLRSRLTAVRRIIRLLEQNQAPGMARVTSVERYHQLETQLVQERTQLEALYGETELRWPNLEVRARDGNTLELYATLYWLLCLDTHLTARGLDRFIREVNGQLTIVGDLEEGRFQSTLRTFYLILSALLADCSEKFGTPVMSELNRFESIS